MTLGHHIANAAMEDNGGAPLLYSENDKIQYFLPGTKISTHCHGINEYDRVNNILCLSAANPSPAYLYFLTNFLGLTKKQVYRAIQCEILYQMVCRTSIRTDSDEIVTFYPALCIAGWRMWHKLLISRRK